MINKVSYIIMSVIIFNVLFLFFYYFKIVNFLYIDLLKFSAVLNALIINFLVIIFNVFYIFLYKYIKIYKLSYFKIVFLSLFVGVIMSVILLLKNEHKIIDYLGVISYFVIDIVFLSYSLYFEENKECVFN